MRGRCWGGPWRSGRGGLPARVHHNRRGDVVVSPARRDHQSSMIHSRGEAEDPMGSGLRDLRPDCRLHLHLAARGGLGSIGKPNEVGGVKR